MHLTLLFVGHHFSSNRGYPNLSPRLALIILHCACRTSRRRRAEEGGAASERASGVLDDDGESSIRWDCSGEALWPVLHGGSGHDTYQK